MFHSDEATLVGREAVLTEKLCLREFSFGLMLELCIMKWSEHSHLRQP